MPAALFHHFSNFKNGQRDRWLVMQREKVAVVVGWVARPGCTVLLPTSHGGRFGLQLAWPDAGWVVQRGVVKMKRAADRGEGGKHGKEVKS
jgi:hypothetical protein